ncbi:CaiB/BaiF CoA-transferase family protein [Mesorhizobium sp. YR577]|uniref:CaiB/BaiF CoA transferase family protein n=1 Tax=Mesorhizobium sp. YR577 TaxID=1884373 RepID=UPI0008DED2F1|nr:CaiB/BaiF CoA-transferase family protein [Mesorhizobium sp. YR577]SFU16926.1 Crotonobetainyl-CoA:carnitine CoA-transferase CaiB [Mesorhizobium sp. YR577]
MPPLNDLFVLDFSTLLPGPLASLMLAQAGARVIKIERPDGGDAMRSYEPVIDGESLLFAMLNRGKESIALDLKSPDAKERLRPLIEKADVLLEQFRPGVMERLGLGYDELRKVNPRLIYCSITGWGQTGPKAQKAGHDVNFQAEAGLLGLSHGNDGAPILPPFLAGDIAGGALPAMINILLALRQRDVTGQGSHIDIAMTENLFAYLSWGLSAGFAGRGWPASGSDLVTGGSPRYQIFRTADDRFIAAAPIEDKFWSEFTKVIALPENLVAPDAPMNDTMEAIADIVRRKTAAEWQSAFAGRDVCCSVVATLEEAVADIHVQARGLFDRGPGNGEIELPALPVPIAPQFRSNGEPGPAPVLGNSHLYIWAN